MLQLRRDPYLLDVSLSVSNRTQVWLDDHILVNRAALIMNSQHILLEDLKE